MSIELHPWKLARAQRAGSASRVRPSACEGYHPRHQLYTLYSNDFRLEKEGRETILAKLLNTFDSNYGLTQPSTKLFTTYVHTLYIQYLRLAERFAKQTMTMAEWNIAARVKKTAMGRLGPG